MPNYRLIYGHDPLCGWCYGFIPAIEQFAAHYPDVPVELVVGGLFSADQARPYTDMVGYITRTFPRIEDKTGRIAAPAFFDMIADDQTGLLQSATPSHILLQVKARAPEQAAAFAHALQKAHFEHGKGYNTAETYEEIAAELDVTGLDIKAALAAKDDTPLITGGYSEARALDISSYPKCLVMDGEAVIGEIDGIYDPEAFRDAFAAIISRAENGTEETS